MCSFEDKAIGCMAIPSQNRNYQNENKITMDQLVINIGGGYGASDSAFKCSLTGLFLFHVSVMNSDGGFR